MDVPVNYVAVGIAALAAIILGFLWYGPFFGKKWLAESGMSSERVAQMQAKGMTSTYAIMVLSSLLMAYVLSHVLIFASTYMNVSGVQAGLSTGFWNWLGFVVPVSLGSVLWENKSWTYWFITAGYYLVSLLLMGSILAIWGTN